MSNLAIRRAFETRLSTMSPALATQFENMDFPPVAADTPYQRVSLLPAEPRNPETGTFAQFQGVFSVVLAYPLKTGPAAAAARAEAVSAHFRRNLTLTADGVTVSVSRTPTVAAGFIDGARYLIPVSVRYHADVST
jgi:hypothetical protein